jgi:hypothetical protein
MHRLSAAFVLLGVLTQVGCTSAKDPAPADGGRLPTEPTPDELASGGNCPAPTGAGTTHEGVITADETWTAAGSPHKVTAALDIRAKVTIEACAVVQVAKDATISVGEPDVPGSLVALGTSELVNGQRDVRPVTFDALTAGSAWGPLLVQPKGTVQLAVTALLNGGADVAGNRGALMVRGVAGGTNDGPITRSARVDHVLIERSASYGVNLEAWGTFTADSTALWVRKSGSADFPSAVRLEPGIAATLPSPLVATGNLRDEVLLLTSKTFMANDTLVSRGLPYRAKGPLYVSASQDGAPVTLKVEPGVTLAFDTDVGSGMYVGSSETRQGILQAIGTAALPILFTSAHSPQAPGDWMALSFRKTPATGSQISYAKVEFAGADATTSGFGCGPVDQGNNAAVIVLGLGAQSTGPATAWIDHTTFENNAGSTVIVSGWVGDGPSFAATNTFGSGSAGCHVSQPQRDTSVTGGDACEGRRNVCN